MKQLLVAFLLIGAAITTQAQTNSFSTALFTNKPNTTASNLKYLAANATKPTLLLTDDQKQKLTLISQKAQLAKEAIALLSSNKQQCNNNADILFTLGLKEILQLIDIESNSKFSTDEKLQAINTILDNYIAAIGTKLDTQDLETLYR